MIVGLDQGWVLPPHWRAIMNIMMAGTKMAKPMMSKSLIMVFGTNILREAELFGKRMKVRKAIVTAPQGRLM